MKEKYLLHLTSQEKYILNEKGTEVPFSGIYNDFFEAGVFTCRACEAPLYESNTKFNSGCGWPSFDDEIDGAILRSEDLSTGRLRTEICCSKCNGHLGHVFHGEQITDKDTRHCVNSLSIRFKPYSHLERATFGRGCFWYIQKIFAETKGVYLTSVGYMGGATDNPTYQDVYKGDTNHAEVVDIYFNPDVVMYPDLLHIFWQSHDPKNLDKKVLENSNQYRSVIFYYSDEQKKMAEESIRERSENYSNIIATQLAEASNFYRAEEYHQDYLNKNNLSDCDV